MGKKILLVEGNDEVIFFEKLKSLFEFDYEVSDGGGKDNLRNKIQSLLTRTGDDFPESLGIVRDADEDAGSAFQSVKSAIENTKGVDVKAPAKINTWNTGCITKIGVFILPGDGSSGALEDLLLQVANSEIMKCVDSFINCVEIVDVTKFKKSKAKLKAFLCVGDDHEVVTAGSAIKKGNYFNLESDVFNKLKSFLQEFAKQ